MLSLLHIENIAVIECADISFDQGFNVLTGETGAGKSIVIDAISAVLGQRTSRELIRTGAKSALVTAVFSGLPFIPWMEENGFKQGEELLLQREIQPLEKMVFTFFRICCIVRTNRVGTSREVLSEWGVV